MNGKARAESMQFKWMVKQIYWLKINFSFRPNMCLYMRPCSKPFGTDHMLYYTESLQKSLRNFVEGTSRQTRTLCAWSIMWALSKSLSSSISHVRNYFLGTKSTRIISVIWLSGRLGDWVHEAHLSTVPLQGSPEGHQQDEKQGGRGHAR